MELDYSFFGPFIIPVAFIICLVVGYIIKHAIKNETLHQFIPAIVAILGVIVIAWDSMSFTPLVVAEGLVTGLASTGCYEQFKNILHLTEKGEDDA